MLYKPFFLIDFTNEIAYTIHLLTFFIILIGYLSSILITARHCIGVLYALLSLIIPHQTRACAHTHTNTYTHAIKHAHTCIYTRAHIHTPIHTNTHKHMHTLTHAHLILFSPCNYNITCMHMCTYALTQVHQRKRVYQITRTHTHKTNTYT